MPSMTIGKLAKAVGIGVETVRFYEREGLIQRPMRKFGAGYRKYDPEVIQRLSFIRRAKDLGFSLKEIKELLSIHVACDGKSSLVKERVQLKIADVERKMGELQAIRMALEQLNELCSGEGSTSECPILDALSRNQIEEKEELRPCCQRRNHHS